MHFSSFIPHSIPRANSSQSNQLVSNGIRIIATRSLEDRSRLFSCHFFSACLLLKVFLFCKNRRCKAYFNAMVLRKSHCSLEACFCEVHAPHKINCEISSALKTSMRIFIKLRYQSIVDKIRCGEPVRETRTQYLQGWCWDWSHLFNEYIDLCSHGKRKWTDIVSE